MTYHGLPLTYKDKILAVKVGESKQSIRQIRVHEKSNKISLKKVGDELGIYTWSGAPYRSKHSWDFRTKIESVDTLWYALGGWSLCIDGEVIIGDYGVPEFRHGTTLVLDDKSMAEYARKDWINPPTRDGLEQVLMTLNGLDTLEGTMWQVITWIPPKKKEGDLNPFHWGCDICSQQLIWSEALGKWACPEEASYARIEKKRQDGRASIT
jgi:hypothetical protein